MTTYFDTSALIPLCDPDDEAHLWCVNRYSEAAAQNPPVVICDIVYCEFTIGMENKEAADKALKAFAIERVKYTDDVLFRAGRAFLSYKERMGKRDTVLPDFLVGAIAEIDHSPVVTRDDQKLKTYFPGVGRIHPSSHP
jgi:predicted nucleic acid-binding protein